MLDFQKRGDFKKETESPLDVMTKDHSADLQEDELELWGLVGLSTPGNANSFHLHM